MTTPIGHRTLRLKQLDPKLSPAFSPNLYRWMRAKSHFYRDGGTTDTVYRVMPGTKLAEDYGAGTLFIGYPYNESPSDKDFSGARLMQVLCNGGKAQRFCFPHMAHELEVIEGFWEAYLSVGRCAIDPGHYQHFIGDRYKVDNENPDNRTCLWCGAKQHLVRTPRTVLDTAWDNV